MISVTYGLYDNRHNNKFKLGKEDINILYEFAKDNM